jgi:hypothetical protein
MPIDYSHNPVDEMIGRQMIVRYLVAPRYRDLAWQAFKDSYEAARQCLPMSMP